jgi:hypothetical protein
MSENARRKTTPESHLIEHQLATAPSRAWAGHVRITGDGGTLMVPGTWHLEVPNDARPLHVHGHGRSALPLPAVTDLPAWREHLVRLVMLQIPGMQLRVRDTIDGAWQSLELAAPTAPASVTHIDRDGLRTLLGPTAELELSIIDRSTTLTP